MVLEVQDDNFFCNVVVNNLLLNLTVNKLLLDLIVNNLLLDLILNDLLERHCPEGGTALGMERTIDLIVLNKQSITDHSQLSV